MTLVISLRESKARRQKIAECLQAIGLSYRIVDAILGSSLPRIAAYGNCPCTLHGALRPRPWPRRDRVFSFTQACLGSVPFVRRQHRLNSGGRCGCSPNRSDWCPGRAVAGRVGLTQDRRNWRRARTAGARNFVWKDYPHARDDGVLSRLRYIANGCRSAPKCDAPGQIFPTTFTFATCTDIVQEPTRWFPPWSSKAILPARG